MSVPPRTVWGRTPRPPIGSCAGLPEDEEEEAPVNIGEPERTIQIEPVTVPVPEPLPMPVPEPLPLDEPQPVERPERAPEQAPTAPVPAER